MRSSPLAAADGVVVETVLGHGLFVVNIAAVEDDRCREQLLHQFEVRRAELGPLGQDRQGVRYMWLLLAMHVAEDEGITVEVAAQ